MLFLFCDLYYYCNQLFTTAHFKQDAREAMRVVFFCTHKTYLYAQNEISYEYIPFALKIYTNL